MSSNSSSKFYIIFNFSKIFLVIFGNNSRDFSPYFSKFSKILLEIVLENISGYFLKYEGHSKNEACFAETKNNAMCRTWNMSFENYLRLRTKVAPRKAMEMLSKFWKL